jgi:galactose-1-phosphate uridylyltransferase
MKPPEAKQIKLHLLTEEELERFDHMLTALAQAYWALVTQRTINVPMVAAAPREYTPEEESFYQLHFDFNERLEDPSF